MSDEEKICCCHCRTKHRDDKEERDLLTRLSRIEGQIRGIRGMVEKDAYCPDILTQVAAASAALNSFSKVLLANHIKTCVAQDIREGKDETIDELLTTLQKLMRNLRVKEKDAIRCDSAPNPPRTLRLLDFPLCFAACREA